MVHVVVGFVCRCDGGVLGTENPGAAAFWNSLRRSELAELGASNSGYVNHVVRREMT